MKLLLLINKLLSLVLRLFASLTSSYLGLELGDVHLRPEAAARSGETPGKRAMGGTARAGKAATDHGAKPGFGAKPDVPSGSEPFYLHLDFKVYR